jgi:type I restriction enzyme R subunit
MLGLRFAFSTNGHGIIEFDYLTGQEKELDGIPRRLPDLWRRYVVRRPACPTRKPRRRSWTAVHTQTDGKKAPRYYQEIAINRTRCNACRGRDADGNPADDGDGDRQDPCGLPDLLEALVGALEPPPATHRKPRILFLADRNILVDDPMAKTSPPSGTPASRSRGKAIKSREMYFAIYQAIAADEDERRPGLYKEYAPDFFDLIVVDECHRGSARDESNWREILEYFQPAYPARHDGDAAARGQPRHLPLLRRPDLHLQPAQGIDDGFLAPYRVHRVLTTFDAAGWRPSAKATGPLRPRDPRRRVHDQGLRAGCLAAKPAPRPSPTTSPTS